MEIIAYKGRHFSGVFFMNLYLILHYYSCTATTLYCHYGKLDHCAPSGYYKAGWVIIMLLIVEDIIRTL